MSGQATATAGNQQATTASAIPAPVATLQGVWDVSSDTDKNTFVDANTFEIQTFIHDGAAATAAIARMTGLVLAEESAMAKFVDILDTFGYWAPIDDFASYRLQTEANSLIGWKLKTHDAINAPIHTPGLGFALNSTTQLLDSNYNPTLDAVSFAQNDAMIGAYINTITVDATTRDLFSGTDTLKAQQRNATQTRFNINDSNSTNRTGFNMANDTLITVAKTEASANHRVFYNGSEQIKYNGTTAAIPNVTIKIGAFSSGAARFFNGSVGAFVVGAGIGFDHAFFHGQLKILNSDLAAI